MTLVQKNLGICAVVSALVSAHPRNQLTFRLRETIKTCQLAAIKAFIKVLWPKEPKPIVHPDDDDLPELVEDGMLFDGESPFIEFYNGFLVLQHLEHVDDKTRDLLDTLVKMTLDGCGCKMFDEYSDLRHHFDAALKELE